MDGVTERPTAGLSRPDPRCDRAGGDDVAMDVTHTLPSTSDIWHTYARGSHMNMPKMGVHRYWYQPGAYLFKLTPGSFDTHQLKDGVYRLTVTAWDAAGNHSSASQVVNVHNRKTWLVG